MNEPNKLCFPLRKQDKAIEIIKKHKLLNYVLKNKKCASMYGLNDDEIKLLKEWTEK